MNNNKEKRKRPFSDLQTEVLRNEIKETRRRKEPMWTYRSGGGRSLLSLGAEAGQQNPSLKMLKLLKFTFLLRNKKGHPKESVKNARDGLFVIVICFLSLVLHFAG